MPNTQLLGHIITDIRVTEARFEELDKLLRLEHISPEYREEVRAHSERLKTTRMMLMRTLIRLNGLTGLDPYWRIECKSIPSKSCLDSLVSQLWLWVSSVFFRRRK